MMQSSNINENTNQAATKSADENNLLVDMHGASSIIVHTLSVNMNWSHTSTHTQTLAHIVCQSIIRFLLPGCAKSRLHDKQSNHYFVRFIVCLWALHSNIAASAK